MICNFVKCSNIFLIAYYCHSFKITFYSIKLFDVNNQFIFWSKINKRLINNDKIFLTLFAYAMVVAHETYPLPFYGLIFRFCGVRDGGAKFVDSKRTTLLLSTASATSSVTSEYMLFVWFNLFCGWFAFFLEWFSSIVPCAFGSLICGLPIFWT